MHPCPRHAIICTCADGGWLDTPAASRSIRQSQQARRALSLIELLVVVVIILILAGILLPGMRLARAAAKKAHCASNLRQIGCALFAYRPDYEHQLPQRPNTAQLDEQYPHFIDRANFPIDDPSNRFSNVLLDYTDSIKHVYYCPANSQNRSPSRYWPSTSDWGISGTYQMPFWVASSRWLIAKPSYRNPGSLRPLVMDFCASTDAAGRTLVVKNHARGAGIAGMNVMSGDGAVRWSDSTAARTTYCTDVISHYYWHWINN